MYEYFSGDQIHMLLHKSHLIIDSVLAGLIGRLFSTINRMAQDRKNINVTIRDSAENKTTSEAEANVCGGSE